MKHQKLVWKAHRQVCGPSVAHPFRLPVLKPAEAATLRHLAEKPFSSPPVDLDPVSATYKKSILARGKASVRQMLEDIFCTVPGAGGLDEILALAQDKPDSYTVTNHDDLVIVRAANWLALQTHCGATAVIRSSEFNYVAELEFCLMAFTDNWLALPAQVHTGFLHRALVLSTLPKLETAS
ncbi:hypothetical protein JCM3770_003580 [Rhodotorula araucariae]